MKRIVECGGVEFQKHIGSGTDDVRYRIAAAQSHQHRVRGQRPVVYRQIVLYHVTLIPNSEIVRKYIPIVEVFGGEGGGRVIFPRENVN